MYIFFLYSSFWVEETLWSLILMPIQNIKRLIRGRTSIKAFLKLFLFYQIRFQNKILTFPKSLQKI